MSSMIQRMTRAALLDVDTYEEVEADRSATRQAFAVVLLSSLGAGIGSLENNGWSGMLYIAAAALVGWWVWAALTCFIGTRILPGPGTVSNLGELLRTLGFASAPGMLLVLAIIPGIASVVFIGCGIWMLVAMVIAVRQALDYEGRGGTARAIAVCAIGFPFYALLVAGTLLAVGPWPV